MSKKKLFQIFSCCAILWMAPNWAFGQFGISGFYSSNTFDNWSQNDQEFFTNGYGVQGEYRIRLKNVRVEFLPNIGFQSLNGSDFRPSSTFQDVSAIIGRLGVQTNIFPLHLKGDCDCPTFRKEGSSFTKGWYLSAHLGGNQSRISASNEDMGEVDHSVYLDYGLGTGVEFGLSEKLVIAPFVTFLRINNADWESINSFYPEITDDLSQSNGHQWRFGLRLIFE